ncbi:RagB/SusD family nutrient uptake outer membrane protein [Marinifilum caeruleilacunae]|uniref:RagB/SusD family nutrient uptake outer membrane protein n=1 Tax=Marinifilum caeruleilacunae TaxID=2499076 RepID=A0ABX1WTR0_9BACT|nr:RagB/SusD family nutrient uptake outer membrane protein [Marinifilum caeruleilacunae]NOU59315.1 RagB/SusD family nutrient uptake outer membrane protein [Marinifilum caeruleilacunae]
MNKIKYTIFGSALVVFCLSFTACDKQLDLAPEDTTVETEVFQSASSAESALMDVYNKTYEANKSTAYTIGDFTTDLLVVHNSYNQTVIAGELPVDDYTTEQIWGNSYSAINVANVIIKSVPELGTYNEDLENQHVAEAKFLRAYNYLVLLKLFGDGALTGDFNGLGLPLQLTPYEGTEYDSGKALTRSSVQEVYLQIITDLTEALPHLLDNYEEDLETRSRATKGSAHALLSRVYLYMGDYANAASEAEFLIGNSNYTLNSDLRSVFPISSGYDVPLDKEFIYAIPLTFNNGNHQFGTHYYSYYFKSSYHLADDFIAKYSDTDQRKTSLIWQGYSGGSYGAKLTSSKFNNSEGRDNIPMIRLSEMYLTRAECLARTSGVTQEAIDLLNTVASRADANFSAYSVSDFTSGTDLVDRILLEREKELCFEGLHRYDLIRTGRKLQYKDLPENRYVLPIPKREIDITKGSLEQNPGYL